MNRTLLSTAFAVVIGLIAATSVVAAPSGCPTNFFGGQAPDLVNPKLVNKTQELCYSEFALLHSALTRTPLWSADHLTVARVTGAKHERRRDAADTFHEEERLPTDDRAWLKDYARSGYDRGHMSPSGDFDNPVAQGESFTLANMVPQAPDNNRGLWSHLEGVTRTMGQKYGEVWVVTVPIFAGGQTQWLHDRVAIPAKLAKAIYVPDLNGAAAYLTDNAPGNAWQAISIVELRDISGIDAFPALPESVKQKTITLPAPEDRGSHSRGRSDD